MRIPTSVIVMSVVTAVPFGLGVRDSLKHKDAISAEEFGDGLDFGAKRSARDRAELENYEADMRREAAEREEKAKARVAQLDQLFGAKPAQMGKLLDGIVIGAGAGSFQPEDVRLRIETASRDGLIYVSFDADEKSLNGVDVTINSDYESGDVCEKLDDKLASAWGRATNGAWVDAATHQRATLDRDNCKLRFEKYVEPAAWVAALPMTAIGMSAEKFADQQVVAVEIEDDHMYWTTPGVGFGKGATKLEGFIVKGKIVAVQATAGSDFDSTLAVRDALSAKLKSQPKRVSDDAYESRSNVYDWKSRVPVSLETSDSDRFSVMVGKIPWD